MAKKKRCPSGTRKTKRGHKFVCARVKPGSKKRASRPARKATKRKAAPRRRRTTVSTLPYGIRTGMDMVKWMDEQRAAAVSSW